MKINKTNLKTALEIVKPGLSNKEIIEQSTSFAFVDGRAITYNDDISISHPIPDWEIDGAVKAEELYSFLSKIKKDEVEVTIKENEMILKVGKTIVGLILASEIKLPLEEIGKISKKMIPLNKEFIDGAKLSISCCSSDQSKPIMTCVNVTKNGLEASDNYSIMKVSFDISLEESILIPAKSFAEALKIGPTKMSIGKGWVHFMNEKDTVLSCRIFKDEYPDVTPFLNVKGNKIALPETLSDSLEMVEIFSKRQHFLDEVVTVSIADGKLTISSESDSGWIKETNRIRWEGDPIQFSITPFLLRRMLKETHECISNEKMIKFEKSNWEYCAVLRNMPK